MEFHPLISGHLMGIGDYSTDQRKQTGHLGFHLFLRALMPSYLWRALSISFFSWWASLIWWVTRARNSSKLDRR